MTCLEDPLHLLIKCVYLETAIDFRWELDGFEDLEGDLFILNSYCWFSFLQINESSSSGKEWSTKNDWNVLVFLHV